MNNRVTEGTYTHAKCHFDVSLVQRPRHHSTHRHWQSHVLKLLQCLNNGSPRDKTISRDKMFSFETEGALTNNKAIVTTSVS